MSKAMEPGLEKIHSLEFWPDRNVSMRHCPVKYVLILLVTLASGCESWFSWAVDFDAFMKDVKSTIEPDELREWALLSIEGRGPGDSIDVASIPNCLAAIGGGPSAVFVKRVPGTSREAVDLCWGSGFGHWGLFVGDSALKLNSIIPKHRVVEWVPGIYFYQEIQ